MVKIGSFCSIFNKRDSRKKKPDKTSPVCPRQCAVGDFFRIGGRSKVVVEKLRNMKISKRLMVSYAVVLVLLIVGIIVSVTNLVSIGNRLTEFYEHPFKVSSCANIVNERFEGMQKSVFRAISTEDEAITKEAIENAKDAAAIISENMAIIEELYIGDPEDVNKLKSQLQTLAPLREEVLSLAGSNKNAEAAAYMEANNIPCIIQAQEYLNVLIESADTNANKMIQGLQKSKVTATIILIVLGVVSAVISMAFAKFITNSITRPVEELKTVTDNLVAGNLDISVITYESKDEMGALSKNMKEAMRILTELIEDVSYLMKEIADGNLNVKTRQEDVYVGAFRPMLMSMRAMTSNVSDTISEINESSNQVSAGASQMAESAQGLAEGATEQAGAIEELNATVENVADMSQGTAEDTKKASVQINTSVSKAEGSRQEMEKLMVAMERIDATSKEIENIIAAIEDIASQTNLLSLNASIEAARAGEAGKGFAVVADQIGKLASDSAQSASNTRELIMKTLEEIKVGNEITVSASESFSEVIKDIEEFSQVVQMVSEKSLEQYESLHQVQEGIEQISGVVQNNSATAQESSATSEELAAQADNLRELVARFRLKQPVS